MSIGFRIVRDVPRADDALVERFRPVPTAHLSDCMSRLPGAGAALRPMHRGSKLLGSALTVKTRAGDNLMVHKAIDIALPGDVVVVDAGGDLSQAIIGELMMRHAQHRGVAGLVIDGAIRDLGTIGEDDYPVYAAGVTHRGPYKDGPGEINVPIVVGAMVVQPGDVVVGDEDGIVTVPLAEAEQVLERAMAVKDKEAATMAAILDGTVDRSWVDKQLAARGFSD